MALFEQDFITSCALYQRYRIIHVTYMYCAVFATDVSSFIFLQFITVLFTDFTVYRL